MEPWVYAVTAAVVFVSCLLQTAVGFGAGMLVIPVLLFVGLSLPEALTIVVFSLGAQVAWGAWRLRAQTPWRDVLPVALMRLAFFPLGLWLLTLLVSLGSGAVKQAVGAVVLAALGVQAVARVEPRDRVGPGWAVLVSAASGVLAGVVGMGGPPLVLWAMAHRWPADRARAALWSIFTIGFPPFAALLLWRFGWDVAEAAALGAACIPAVFAGYAAGRALTRDWTPRRLRVAMASFLVVIALAAILEPIVAG